MSKRWREAFYATPSLWRRLELAEPREQHHLPAEQRAQRLAAWLATQRSLLQRVGASVEVYKLAGRLALPEGSASLLRLDGDPPLLRPDVLRELSLTRRGCWARAAGWCHV